MRLRRWIAGATLAVGLVAWTGPAAAQSNAVLVGRVVDAETEAPIPEVNVTARQGRIRRGASTDATGRFRLTVPPGTYRVAASVVGYEPQARTVAVSAGATERVRFRLSVQPYVLNEILVQSTDRGQARAPTSTVQRVEPAAIAQQDAVDVSELAALVPATHAATNSRGQTILYFRDAGDRQVGQFFDGALLNVPWDNRVDISLIPAHAIASITAVKGAVPVTYGTNVIGGAVNVKSRTLDRPGRHTDVTGETGTAAHRRTSIAHLGRTERWDYTATVQYAERGDQPLPDGATLPFSQPGAERRVNTDRRLVSGLARASYRFDGGAHLGVTALHVDAEQGIAPESHVDPATTGVRYWRYPLWQMSTAIVSGRTPFGTQSALRGAAWGSRFAQDIAQYQSVAYEALQEVQQDRDWTAGVRLIGTHEMGTDGAPWGTLTLALNGLTTRHRQTNRLFPQPTDSTSTYRQHIFSVGAEAEANLTPRLTTTAGLSLDGTATPDTGPFPGHDPLTAIGATLGATYDVSETVRLRASGGRRGRFPTMRELFGAALGKFVPNPELQPVTAWIGEVGVEHQGPRFSGSMTAFVNRVQDTIGKRTFQSGPDAGKEQRINLDGSRVAGVETAARWQATGALELDGHLTWMQPRGIEGGDTQPLDEKPDWLGTLRATYDLPFGLSAHGQVRYTAGTETRNEQNAFVTLPDALVLDARLAYALDRVLRGMGVEDAEVYARVDNLTDAARFLQLGLPGPGRRTRAGVALSF